MTYADYIYDTTDGKDLPVPDFHTILQAIQDNGVVGEEETSLTLAVTSVGNPKAPLVVVYSPARGGKDWVLGRTLGALYHDSEIYKHPTDESDTAGYYAAKESNKFDIHYAGDLATMHVNTEKLLKDWGEGNDASRRVTDITKSADEDDRTITMTQKCPRVVYVTAATDNSNFDLNDYQEIRKRAQMISVDTSKEQTERIIERKAAEHAGTVERVVDPIAAMGIKNYFKTIPSDLFQRNKNNRILKPGANNIALQTTEQGRAMPTEFNEARFDFDRLLYYIGNVALINHADRMAVDTGRGLVLLATPVDVWLTMQIMGNSMVMSALNLTEEDRAILRFLRDIDFVPDAKDIQQGLRAQGYNIRDSDVKRSLESMRESGYVQVNRDTTRNTYTLSGFASVTDIDASLDYGQIVEAAAEEVFQIPDFPNEVAQEYVDRYLSADALIAVHPFTGEAVDITEDTSFEEAIANASADRANIFEETPMYARSTDEDEGQATLNDGGPESGTLS